MTDSDVTVLLTTDDIRGMNDEIAQLESEILRLEGLLGRLLSRRKMVNDLLVALGKPLPGQVDKASTKILPASPAKTTQNKADTSSATWMSEIYRVLSDMDNGGSYEDLREGINLGPLAERLKQSDKGLYGGVAKLEAKGTLVKHNGRLFTEKTHADFLRRLSAGIIADIPVVQVTRPSPIGEAILGFINHHPSGVEGAQIVDELKRNPQFSEVVSKNNSSAYNVLKRMIDRAEIRKEGKLYFPMSDPESNSGAGDDRS